MVTGDIELRWRLRTSGAGGGGWRGERRYGETAVVKRQGKAGDLGLLDKSTGTRSWRDPEWEKRLVSHSPQEPSGEKGNILM